MARIHYRDPDTGVWVPIGTQGPPGPSAVSADANNTAVLGTDSLIFVPAPTPPVLDHGGLTGLGDDDHPHYFNQTRGDARYALTGHSHGATILPADVAPPAIGASSVIGTSADYAREDHTHAGPQASAVTPTADDAAAGAVGVGTAWARSDHKHQVTTAAPVALGAANAAGSAASLARSDHVHIYPTAANVGAATPADVTSAVTTHAGAADPHTGYQKESEKGAVNGYAALDASGLIPTTQLPPLAINDTFTVASEAAMLALTAQRGDMAIRSDNGRTYVLSAEPATVVGNWKEVMAAGQVQSVNGQTGVVLLDATSVGAATSGDISTAITAHTSGSPHVALTSATPSALTPDIAGSAGAGSTSARADHAHNVPAAAPTTNLTASTTNTEGTGSSFARNDHSHAITANVAASPLGAAGAVGTNAALARADHVHIYPTAAQVGADTAGTASGAITTHEGAADPHTGYQKESEKGAVNGYASLDSGGLVPLAQLPAIGVPDEVLIQTTAPTPSVGLDLWVDSDATPSTGTIDHGSISGLADDDHPQYHNDARGDARYVALSGATAMSGPLTAPKVNIDYVDPKLVFNIPGVAASTVRQTATDLEVRNWDDSAYAPLVVADPTTARHAATKGYVDGLRAPIISTIAPASPKDGDIWVKPVTNLISGGWDIYTGAWRLSFGFGYAALTATPSGSGGMTIANADSGAGGAGRALFVPGFVNGDLMHMEGDVTDIVGSVRLTKVFVSSGAFNVGTGAQTITHTQVASGNQEWAFEVMPLSSARVTGVRLYNLSKDPAQVYIYRTGGWVLLEASTQSTPGRNRVINGDFSVNQRAFASTGVNGVYGQDRWMLGASGGTVVYEAKTAVIGELPEAAKNYARITVSGQAAAGDYAALYQRIEDVRTLSGKMATISFWARGSVNGQRVGADFWQHFGTGGSAGVPANGANVAVTTTFQRYSIPVFIPSVTGKTIGPNDSFLAVELFASLGSTLAARANGQGLQAATIDIWGVQVEEGSYATPFEQKSYAEELGDCQRYFQRLATPNSSTFYTFGFSGTCRTTTTVWFQRSLPVSMRIPPVLSFSAGSTFHSNWGSGSSQLSAIAQGDSNTVDTISVTATGVGMVAGAGAHLFQQSGNTAYIDISAEL